MRSDHLLIVYTQIICGKAQKAYPVRRWIESPIVTDSAVTDGAPNSQTTQGTARYIPIKRTCKLLHPHINGGLKVLPIGNNWRTIQRILVISEYRKNSGWYAISPRPLVSIWHTLSHQNFRKTKTSAVIRLIQLKQRPRGLHWPKVMWSERQDLNSGLLDLRELKCWGLFCACVSE